jgi:capsid assembly protease
MSHHLARIAADILNVPLFLDARKAATITAVLGDRIGIDGGSMDALARRSGPPLEARAPVRKSGGGDGYTKIGGGVAVVHAVGSLVTRGSSLDAASGLVSYDVLAGGVRAADADPEVTSIVLDFHSPGGSAAGAIECADIVHAVAQKRPVVALANSLMCSAAYLVAAAASKIVVTKTATVGSVGVVLLHVDRSRQIEGKGLTPTFIFSGKHKVDGNELQPLSAAVKSDLQAEVDLFYGMMTDSIAAHRPRLTRAAIRATEARTYLGADAVTAGLADEIGSMDSVTGELAKLHKAVSVSKYDRIAAVYGKIDADHARLTDAHAAGVRAGMAAALAGSK